MEQQDYIDLIEGRPNAELNNLKLGKKQNQAFSRFKYLRLINLLNKINLPLLYIPSNGRFGLIQLGTMKTHTGLPMLSGISSIRLILYTRSKPSYITASINIGHEIKLGQTNPVYLESRHGIGAWIINLWFDSSRIPAGRHKLWIKAYNKTKIIAKMRRFVRKVDSDLIEAHIPAESKNSDSYISSNKAGIDNIDEFVLGLPASVHKPRKSLFEGKLHSILVIRTDQLGDVSASLPAFQHLRKMFAEAVITVVAQPGVIPILEASAVADEFIPINLDYSSEAEQRFITRNNRREFYNHIKDHNFDMSIDLSPGADSRELLLLCKSRYRVGFKPEMFSFLDFGIEVISRDKLNGKSILSHAAHVTMLVTALSEALNQRAPPVPRLNHTGDASILASYGLTRGKYIVIHTGARHPLNKWPIENFMQLAINLHNKHNQTIVIFVDDPNSLPDEYATRTPLGIQILSKCPVDDFDTILSNASLMIGNDSGPKHLSNMRGVPVVSVSVPRLNWQEWGQNINGLIVTKQVPCAGCGINDLQFCGKSAICIKSIPVDDVVSASNSLLH